MSNYKYFSLFGLIGIKINGDYKLDYFFLLSLVRKRYLTNQNIKLKWIILMKIHKT